MSASTTVTILVVAQIVCFLLFCLPLVVYHYRNFINLSQLVQMQKRYPQILKLEIYMTIAWFCIGGPLFVVDLSAIAQSKFLKQLIPRITLTIGPAITCALFCSIAWRYWHIFFDLKYSSSLKNSEWKYHLDPSIVDHNFWLTHKKNYGSTQYTKKIVIIFYIVSTCIMTIAFNIVINTDYLFIGHAIGMLPHLILNGVILALAYKIPKYTDHFLIRYEATLIYIGLIAVSGVGSLLIMCGLFVYHLLMIGVASIVSILLMVISMISIWWVPKKILLDVVKLKLAKEAAKNAKRDIDIDSKSVGSFDSNVDDNQKTHHFKRFMRRISANNHDLHQYQNRSKSYELHTILSHEKSFKIFMQQLAKEFSVECLLCLIEVVQFKFLTKERFDIVKPGAITSAMSFVDNYPMHNVVPLSRMNRETFDFDLSKYSTMIDDKLLVESVKKVCLRLYIKYIETGSELEVNVSYETRSRLTNLMMNPSFFMKLNIIPNELYSLYDDVAKDMFGLMQGSFYRFKLQPTYEYACKVLNDVTSKTSVQ